MYVWMCVLMYVFVYEYYACTSTYTYPFTQFLLRPSASVLCDLYVCLRYPKCVVQEAPTSVVSVCL